MAPHISPNKTMEGLFGGMAGTIILCLILSAAVDFSILIGFLMGVIVAVMAPMGDLFESYLKRACDVKDSGNILPGHGGMMDRFDSLLFVAPAVLFILKSDQVWCIDERNSDTWKYRFHRYTDA